MPLSYEMRTCAPRKSQENDGMPRHTFPLSRTIVCLADGGRKSAIRQIALLARSEGLQVRREPERIRDRQELDALEGP